MLLKLRSLPVPNRERRQQISDVANTVEVAEIARTASGEFVLRNAKEAA